MSNEFCINSVSLYSLVETFKTSLRKFLDGIGWYKRNGGSNYDSLKVLS